MTCADIDNRQEHEARWRLSCCVMSAGSHEQHMQTCTGTDAQTLIARLRQVAYRPLSCCVMLKKPLLCPPDQLDSALPCLCMLDMCSILSCQCSASCRVLVQHVTFKDPTAVEHHHASMLHMSSMHRQDSIASGWSGCRTPMAYEALNGPNQPHSMQHDKRQQTSSSAPAALTV